MADYKKLCVNTIHEYVLEEFGIDEPFDDLTSIGLGLTTSEDYSYTMEVFANLESKRVWREELHDDGLHIPLDIFFDDYAAMYDWLCGNLDFCWLMDMRGYQGSWEEV